MAVKVTQWIDPSHKSCFLIRTGLLGQIYLGQEWTIDVKMVVFQCPWVAWRTQTSIRFPPVKKKELNLPNKAENSTYLIRSMSKNNFWDLSHKEVKRWDSSLEPGQEFDRFKLPLESCIFKCISWLNVFYFSFLGWWLGYSEEGTQTYLMTPIFAS